jgi:hypothetical protein
MEKFQPSFSGSESVRSHGGSLHEQGGVYQQNLYGGGDTSEYSEEITGTVNRKV